MMHQKIDNLRTKKISEIELQPLVPSFGRQISIKINSKRLPPDFFGALCKKQSKNIRESREEQRCCFTERKNTREYLNKEQVHGEMPEANVTSFFKMAQISTRETEAPLSPNAESRETAGKAYNKMPFPYVEENTSIELPNNSRDEFGYTFSEKTVSSFRIAKTMSVKKNELSNKRKSSVQIQSSPQQTGGEKYNIQTAGLRRKNRVQPLKRMNSRQETDPIKRKMVEELCLPKIKRVP